METNAQLCIVCGRPFWSHFSKCSKCRTLPVPGLIPAIVRELGEGAADQFAQDSGALDVALDRLLDDAIKGGENE